jgi:hypothetical protein
MIELETIMTQIKSSKIHHEKLNKKNKPIDVNKQSIQSQS